MKEKKKIKGGKRVGSGRKPSGRQKEAVTLYVDVSLFGGKAGARMKLYELWDGVITDTGKKSFIPLDVKDFPPTDREIKQKAVKKEKRPPTTDSAKPASALKPREQPEIKKQPQGFPDAPMVVNKPPGSLDELRKLMPPGLDALERGIWMSTERQKYGI
jgi:hypothetical protein